MGSLDVDWPTPRVIKHCKLVQRGETAVIMVLLQRDLPCLAAVRAIFGRRLAPYSAASKSVGKLNHIAIATKDASGHVAFYRNVLGLPVSERQVRC